MITSTTLPVKGLREQMLINLFEIIKTPYRLIFKRNKKAWTTTLADLEKFEDHSLGKDLYKFLQRNNFQIESKLESHDVGHVLLGYKTEVADEISMQYFYLASGKKSPYSLITAILGYIILPEYHKNYLDAFRSGKKAYNFHHWNFEHLLHEKTNSLKALIFKKEHENILYI